MFAIAHANIMRIQLFVPQEAAVEVKPGSRLSCGLRNPWHPFPARLHASPTPWTRGREPADRNRRPQRRW